MPIFMFHDIRDPPYKYPERYECRSFLRTATFMERLHHIQSKYMIVPLLYILRNKDRSEGYAALTFDDGLYDHYKSVYPYLKANSMPATFFVPSESVLEGKMMYTHKIQYIAAYFKHRFSLLKEELSLLLEECIDTLWETYSTSLWTEKENYWSKEDVFLTRLLREYRPVEKRLAVIDVLFEKFIDLSIEERLYMTIEEVKEIARTERSLFMIGGHGHASHSLTTISEEDQVEEIRKSALFLQEEVGIDKSDMVFAYPNGSYSEAIIDILKQHGFIAGLTTERDNGLYNMDEMYTVKRIDGSQHTFESKIVLCGVQDQGIDIFCFLREKGIKVTHIVTITEEEAIRQRASGWVDYGGKTEAELYNADRYGLKSEKDHEYFHTQRFDVLILGGWQRLIPENILSLVKYGCIGQHGSSDYLPKYRGRSPINWSIILGKKRIVWHLFKMTTGVDDGAIIDFSTFEINDHDTCETVYFKVSIVVKHMLAENIPKLLNDSLPEINQIGNPSYYPKRTPEDGQIDWTSSVYAIHNLIKGVTSPYPGAYTLLDGTRIIIWKAQPFSSFLSYYIDNQYGEIVEVFNPKTYVVKCEEGLLLVTHSTYRGPRKGIVFNQNTLHTK